MIIIIMTNKLLILQRWWKYVCSYAWVSFISYETIMGLNYIFSNNPICSGDHIDYSNYYWYSMFFVLGGFSVVLSNIVIRIINTDAKEISKKCLFYIALNLILITTIATILSIVFNWGGICIDQLGVVSHAVAWGEWFSCCPIIVFCIITLANHNTIRKSDIMVLLSLIASLLCGFLIIFSNSYALSIVLLIFAFILTIPTIILPWYYTTNNMTDSNIFKQYKKISVWVSIFFPLYGITYLLGFTNVINKIQTLIIYQYISLFTKCLFIAAIMDVHMNILIDADIMLIREKEGNDTRRSFMKYIFHEVRTPLNSMSLGIEYMIDNPTLDKNIIEVLKNMQSSVLFMSETLNNVLNLHKIEENKWQIEMIPFSIEEILKEIETSFYSLMKSKKITLQCMAVIPANIILISDKIKIQHVLCNLISNAIKYTNTNGTVAVVVTLHDNNLLVSVQDTGCGIAQENQSKLFMNYSQILPTTFQQTNGSGLGLMFCKNIIDMLEGTIYLKSSKVNEGSIFEFKIPIKISNEMKSDSHILERIVPQTTLTYQYNDIIPLIIDDHEASRKIFLMYLKKIGIDNVQCAKDGMMGYNMVSANLSQYNILFVDNLMPIMNGVDMTKKLREKGYNNMIIGVTGNVIDQDIKEFLDAGADYIIIKPVKITELTSLLNFIKKHGYISRTTKVTKLMLNDMEFNWVDLSSITL
jgi:signal transduction histidine kinase/CheY-like chemotaxis protein